MARAFFSLAGAFPPRAGRKPTIGQAGRLNSVEGRNRAVEETCCKERLPARCACNLTPSPVSVKEERLELGEVEKACNGCLWKGTYLRYYFAQGI